MTRAVFGPLRWLGSGLAVAAPLALGACESVDLQSYNPFADLQLPKVELPSVELPSLGEPLPTYAAADLLPTMGFTVFAEQVARVDGPNGGYDGPVEPLAAPVALSRPEVPRLDVFARVRGGAGDYQLHGFAGLANVQVDTLWDVRVVVFQAEGRRLSGLNPPLARGQVLTTPEGDTRGVALGFPALEVRGNQPPAKDSAEYQALAEALRFLSVPTGGGDPVKVGDSLGLPVALSRIMARTVTKPVRNDAATRVIGQTVYRGRTALVAQYQGGVAYERGADTLDFAIAGHLLVDIETGLGVLQVLRLTRQGRLDGQAVEGQVLVETAAWPNPDAES